MSTDITTQCDDCGTSVEATIDGDHVDAGCFTKVLVAREENLVEDYTGVGEHIDHDVADDEGAILHTLCEDCCHVCDDHE